MHNALMRRLLSLEKIQSVGRWEYEHPATVVQHYLWLYHMDGTHLADDVTLGIANPSTVVGDNLVGMPI